MTGPTVDAALIRDVQTALAHLYAPAYLQTHPLATRVAGVGARPGAAARGRQLRQLVLESIRALRPGDGASADPRAWRACRILELRYLETAEPPAIQRELGLAKSQYYVEHARAVEAVASLLAERLGRAGAEERPDATPAAPSREPEAGRGETPRGGVMPRAPTSFVGRERELVAIAALVGGDEAGGQPLARLVTLTGPAGTGKTRLASEAAARLTARPVGSVYFVRLGSIRDPDLVLATVAEALGIREPSTPALVARLKARLRDERALLVLDNLEQVIAAGPAIAELLEDAPGAQVLATSREPLRVYGERELPVGPLTLAEPDGAATAAAVAQSEAVRLFVARARDRKPDFDLTDENAAAVAQICARLDGLPLAIELAAARARLLPPAALLARLENRLALLVDGPRDLPARQQTLRGALDWSHELLDSAERRLFRRLATFDGGWTIEAAEAVCGPEGVLDGLDSLASKSLLAVDERDDQPRFRMLETVREYAREQLVEAGDDASTGRRHAAYFADLAEQAEPELRGPSQADWLRRLSLEHENVIAAMRHALEFGPVEPGLRIAGSLRLFWDVRGRSGGARRLVEALLARPEAAAPTAARAGALNTLGIMAGDAGEHGPAESLFEESLVLWRGVGDRRRIGHLTNNLGSLALRRADYGRARRLFEESFEIKRAAGDRRESVALTLHNLGVVATHEGDYPAARRALEESLAELRATDERWGIANALFYLAWVDLELGAPARARRQLEESLRIWLDLGFERGKAWVLVGYAAAAAAQGDPELALRLGGAAVALCAAIEQPLSDANQEQLDRWLARARAQIDPAAAALAWEAGLATSPADAIELAGTGRAAGPISDAQRSC